MSVPRLLDMVRSSDATMIALLRCVGSLQTANRLHRFRRYACSASVTLYVTKRQQKSHD
jgi:predicted protein tyrosine phosphatase